MSTLSVLLVEDEPGIRKGLSSFLQLKGHRVVAAASCAEGLAFLAGGDFDVVVTDWNLRDDTGDKIIAACSCPVLVMSGVPEQIEHNGSGDRVRVVHKPVLPEDLVTTLDSMCAVEADPEPLWREDLPRDVRARLEIVRAHCDESAGVEILDDGTFVHFAAPLADVAADHCLERLFGDFRIIDRDGRPWVELRCFRDGRRTADTRVLRPDDEWPAPPAAVAVDFDEADCLPRRFLELVAQSTRFRSRGGTVDFLNVPANLHLWAEVSGKSHDMPKRGTVGPRLPEVLSELWR